MRAWEAHPRAALAVRVLVVALPVALALAAAAVVARLCPGPYPVRVLVAVATAGLVVTGLERVGRRLLPLATLLRLSLVFPDEAPSRYRVALRAGSTRDLMTAARLPGTTAQEAALRTVELLGALARHDPATRGHSERVRAYTDLLAEALDVPAEDRAKLRWTSLLHDLGKVTVGTTTLHKHGPLDDAEWEAVREHPTAGAELAGGLQEFLGPWFPTIAQHHERWDGGGYPAGLQGEQICLGARIVAVADAFDVMTSGRSYRDQVSTADAREELVRCGGAQFDPAVVRAMLDVSLGRLHRVARPLALLGAVPLAGSPDVGLAHGAAVHPAAHAHSTVVASGHDAGGSAHHAATSGHATVPGDDR